jgi:poly(3-hydroxybutyrate) depolymerase
MVGAPHPPASTSPPRRAIVAAAALAVLAVVVAGILAWHQGSREAFLARKGTLVAADVTAGTVDPVSFIDTLHLRSSTGLEVDAIVRRPRGTAATYPAAVLVGGIKLGKRIATVRGLDAMAARAIVVAIDYPLKLRRHAWEGRQFLPTASRVRPAAFDAVAEVLLAFDYLDARPDVDRRRRFLVGGSMGSLVVTVAGAVDTRPAAVVALYGGGRLPRFIAHTLEHASPRRPYGHAWALLTGYALAALLTPLAPERYAAAIAPRAYLMVNGSGDTLVPRESVEALYAAARPPKDLIWVASEHVEPSEADLLDRISDVVTGWLGERGLL